MTDVNVVFMGPAPVTFIRKEEGVVATGQTIFPGMAVTKDANDQFIVHGTAGQGGRMYIANLNGWEQETATTQWDVGERREALHIVPDKDYAIVLDVSQTITRGTPLTSAGNGRYRACATDGTETVIFEAREAITTSASATARIHATAMPFGFSATS